MNIDLNKKTNGERLMGDGQSLYNAFMGIAGFLGGWVLNTLKRDQEIQRKELADLTSKVHSIDVLVAGAYVKRDELKGHVDALFAKLDRIEEKVDGKMDKQK